MRSALKRGLVLVCDQDRQNEDAPREGVGCGYSLDELYKTYRTDLIAFIRSQFGERVQDPEETVQQVFANIAASHDSTAIENPRACRRRAARNVIISGFRQENAFNAFKKHKGYLEENGERCIITPERTARDRELLKHVWRILRGMPIKRRQVFIMNRIDGLPCAEIARRMKMSPSGAKKHLSKAVRDLDKGLSELDSEADT